MLARSIYIKEKLEKDKLLGTSYAQLGNAYIGKFQYAEAIKNLQKALGKFSYYNNEYYKGRVLVLLARCFCDIGLLNKSLEYLVRSKKICEKFDEPLLIGRINWIEARIFRSRNEFENAIKKYKVSLLYFRKGELRKPIIDTLLELILTNISCNDIKRISQLIQEYVVLVNKMLASLD